MCSNNLVELIKNSNFLNNKRILIVGASGDIGVTLLNMLIDQNAILGAHYYKNKKALLRYSKTKNFKIFQKNLSSEKSCFDLIEDFVSWAGGIDFLVQLSGDIHRPIIWEKLSYKDWKYDLDINLVMPFFLAQKAIQYMKANGGRIIFTSTASAAHGGGNMSMAYGTAKAGIECITKGLARECAKYNILVNAIAPGFIHTKFHSLRMKRTEKDIQERLLLTPLKRGGTTTEVAGTVMFLLSEFSSYMTGQIITLSGGDWL